MAKIWLFHSTLSSVESGKKFDDTNMSLHDKAKEGWVDTPEKIPDSFWTENPKSSMQRKCLGYLSGKIPGIKIGNQTDENRRCKIWNTLTYDKPVPRNDGELITSLRTDGEYYITHQATTLLERRQGDERFRARLTSWLINQRQLGFMRPEITPEVLRDIEQYQDLTVHKRADGLLQYIKRQTSTVGDVVSFTNQYIHAPAMAWSESSSPHEVVFLLKYLEKQGWVRDMSYPDKSSIGGSYVLTVDGYSRLAEFEKTATVSSQAFIAMWFNESTTTAWEQGIKPAVTEAGYEPKRIDRKEHNNRIDDEIIAEIKRSRFVVADFTQGEDGTRGGVYYEAGFAHGLDIPVIFTCHKDVIDEVHFDTRQYNHIVWEKPEGLRKDLIRRIVATIGDGPLINT